MEYLDSEAKANLFAKYSPGKRAEDTGCAESQIALFTTRIFHLTGHLKQHPKDHSTRLSLLKLVGKRRRISQYIQRRDSARYEAIRQELGLRK